MFNSEKLTTRNWNVVLKYICIVLCKIVQKGYLNILVAIYIYRCPLNSSQIICFIAWLSDWILVLRPYLFGIFIVRNASAKLSQLKRALWVESIEYTLLQEWNRNAHGSFQSTTKCTTHKTMSFCSLEKQLKMWAIHIAWNEGIKRYIGISEVWISFW